MKVFIPVCENKDARRTQTRKYYFLVYYYHYMKHVKNQNVGNKYYKLITKDKPNSFILRFI